MRKGLGSVFLLSGGLYIVQMAWGLSAGLDAPAWTRLYFGHFLLTVMTAMTYITLGFARTGLFQAQALVDFLAGLLVFLAFFFLVSVTLAVLPLPRVLALWPGLFLLYYGFRLRRGKQWRRLESGPE